MRPQPLLEVAVASRWPGKARSDPERWVAELCEAAERGDRRADTRCRAENGTTNVGSSSRANKASRRRYAPPVSHKRKAGEPFNVQ